MLAAKPPVSLEFLLAHVNPYVLLKLPLLLCLCILRKLSAFSIPASVTLMYS